MAIPHVTACTKPRSRIPGASTVLFIAALALAALAPAAHAGRPLVAEDANVLDRGDCEFESFAARASERDAPGTRALSVQAGCGVGLDTQLAMQAVRTRGGAAVDTLALVGKTALRAPTDDRAGFTVAYALGADRPRDDPAWRRFRFETATVLGVMTAPLGAAMLHANLGWTRQRSTGTDSTLWALAVEREGALGPVDLMAETYGDDRSPPWLAVAARWHAIHDRLMLDASYGVQTASGRPRLVTVGLKFAF